MVVVTALLIFVLLLLIFSVGVYVLFRLDDICALIADLWHGFWHEITLGYYQPPRRESYRRYPVRKHGPWNRDGNGNWTLESQPKKPAEIPRSGTIFSWKGHYAEDCEGEKWLRSSVSITSAEILDNTDIAMSLPVPKVEPTKTHLIKLTAWKHQPPGYTCQNIPTVSKAGKTYWWSHVCAQHEGNVQWCDRCRRGTWVDNSVQPKPIESNWREDDWYNRLVT